MSNSLFFRKVNSFLRKWCCVDSLSVVSDPDVRKIPLPTEKNWSFCGAEREMDWIVALRGSADIIRGQVSAALTAAANVNTANSQHEFPCGQLAVGGHGCFCPRQPPRQLQPYLLLRIAQKPVVRIFSIQGAEMRLKCRLHLEMFAVPIYATCRRLGVPNIAHLMSCGAAKKQRIPVAISPICSVATQ